MTATEMHPRNRFALKTPDFGVLAEKHPTFRPYVFYNKRGSSINWKDPEANRELTRVLLLEEFGITWDIPSGFLCPPVPNRLNYIHWIEDLLCLSLGSNVIPQGSNVRGIDIGVGANCIYPLLGVAVNGWHFTATDISAESLEIAKRNAALNGLGKWIDFRKAGRGKLLCGVVDGDGADNDDDDGGGGCSSSSGGGGSYSSTSQVALSESVCSSRQSVIRD
eukprot:Rmarinus@m.13622